jgi:hypothetical protein
MTVDRISFTSEGAPPVQVGERLSAQPGLELAESATPEFLRLAELSPQTIQEALECMETALRYFHQKSDFRAIFLRAYHIITKNVLQEIENPTDIDEPIFLDPAWMSRLAGKFATLYFRSLRTFEKPGPMENAWKLAHGMAIRKESTVLQDVVLGINAHIKYDLAAAICENLREHRDYLDPRLLSKRKRDHDQANTILRRSIQEIKTVIPRAYGGVIRHFGLGKLRLDEAVAIAIVRYHRERVWWDALELLWTSTENERDRVMEKLNVESARLADYIAGNRSLLIAAWRRGVKARRRQDFVALSVA